MNWYLYDVMYLSRRVKNLLITSKEEQRPLRGNRVCCQVFFQYVPVASFYKDDPASQKIAAVHLVESGLASKTDAAEIVGLHRNTISKTVRAKKLLGISKAIRDDRGRKYPIRYTPEIKTHIITLIENCPDLTDTQIASQSGPLFGVPKSPNPITIRSYLNINLKIYSKKSQLFLILTIIPGMLSVRWKISRFLIIPKSVLSSLDYQKS
ncbi:MAG: hypothetical protein GY749_30010 [Desulfobacteraceae bacterium]|nr:hypothetical protein [Desulfobacteraceae bacterium]